MRKMHCRAVHGGCNANHPVGGNIAVQESAMSDSDILVFSSPVPHCGGIATHDVSLLQPAPNSRDVPLLCRAPWVRGLGKLNMDVATHGWRFPIPGELAAHPKVQRPEVKPTVSDPRP